MPTRHENLGLDFGLNINLSPKSGYPTLHLLLLLRIQLVRIHVGGDIEDIRDVDIIVVKLHIVGVLAVAHGSAPVARRVVRADGRGRVG